MMKEIFGWTTLSEYQKMDKYLFSGRMFGVFVVVFFGAYFSCLFWLKGAGIISILPCIGFIHLALQDVKGEPNGKD